MYSIKFGSALVASLLLVAVAASAQDSGAALNLGPVMPAPGWGTTSTYNVYVSENNKPVKNAKVEFFFSAHRGLESSHFTRKTNAQGRATFSVAIPRIWKLTRASWVNANAICDDLGLQKYWRVKN